MNRGAGSRAPAEKAGIGQRRRRTRAEGTRRAAAGGEGVFVFVFFPDEKGREGSAACLGGRIVSCIIYC